MLTIPEKIPPTISLEVLQQLEQFARQLVPELNRIYCVSLPSNHPEMSEGCEAFADPFASNAFVRQALRDEGRWRGEGPFIVFLPFERWRSELLGIFTHELAHVLPLRDIPERDESESFRRTLMAVQAVTIAESEHTRDSVERFPWHQHGLDFIRTCCHLHVRCWRLGVEIGAGNMRFAGGWYSLSPHWQYRPLFEAEAERMIGEPFDLIAAEPMPPKALKLWQHDYSEWVRCNRDATLKIITKGK